MSAEIILTFLVGVIVGVVVLSVIACVCANSDNNKN